LAASYLKRRKGSQSWYYQRWVPADLRQHFGTQVIQRPLGTPDKRLASALAAELNARTEAAFRRARGETVSISQAYLDAHAEIEAIANDNPDTEARQFALDHWREVILEREARHQGAQGTEAIARFIETTDRDDYRPDTQAKLDIISSSPGALPFTKMASRFAESAERDKRVTQKTLAQYRTTHRLFADHFGHTRDLRELTRRDVSKFLERIQSLQPKWASSQKARGKSLDELESSFGGDPQGLSDSSLHRHLSALASLWDWLERRGDVEGNFPGARTLDRARSRRQARPDTGRRVFKPEELNSVIGLSRQRSDSLRWLVPLLYYTGARIGELAGITADQIKKSIEGITYIEIRGDEENRLKNASSWRRMPIHSALLQNGLLDGLPKTGPIFPEFHSSKRGPAQAASRKIGRLIRVDAGIKDPRLTGHCFRHTFKALLRSHGVHPEISDVLTGHKPQSVGAQYGYGGESLEALRDALNRIPPVGDDKTQ